MGPQPNYYPNSFSDVRDDPKMMESNFTVNGNGGNGVNDNVVVYRYDDKDNHNYEQARDLYNSYSKEWKERLHRNLATSINGVHAFIRDRILEELRKVDPLYSDGVRTEINRLAKKSLKHQSVSPKDARQSSRRSSTKPSSNRDRNGSRGRSETRGSEWIGNGWGRVGPPYLYQKLKSNNN